MHGEYKMPGGKLIVIDLAVRDGHLHNVRLSGDFFLEPDAALSAIDMALNGQSTAADDAALATAIRAKLPGDTLMYGISPEAVVTAVRRALAQGKAA